MSPIAPIENSHVARPIPSSIRSRLIISFSPSLLSIPRTARLPPPQGLPLPTQSALVSAKSNYPTNNRSDSAAITKMKSFTFPEIPVAPALLVRTAQPDRLLRSLNRRVIRLAMPARTEAPRNTHPLSSAFAVHFAIYGHGTNPCISCSSPDPCSTSACN